MEENVLNVNFINKLLERKDNFKIGEKVNFIYKNDYNNVWKLSLSREEEQYAPFLFSVEGKKVGSNETWNRRYINLEQAILHIANCFNENANIKDIAKARKGSKWRKEWYNQIDHYSQNCKYGETHGLLIGPHANNLLSEIILTDVDRKLSTKWNYIRNIDDYTCFVKTQEEAQLFLIKLSDELRKYDLTLNHKKTEIAELPMAMTEQWHRQIGNPATFFRNGLFDYISARTYFDSAIEIMHHNNDNSAILNYAIKTLPKDKMTKNAVEYCVKTIMHLCMIYPYLLQIIDKHVFIRYKVSADIIKTFAQSVYDQELKSHNYDGVCFALLFSIKYGFQLDTIKAQDAIDSDSCLFRLLSFLYFKKNAIAKERAQLRQLALNLKSNEEDFGRNWLFVYEVLPQSDLPEDWKTLKSNGISFIRKEYQ